MKFFCKLITIIFTVCVVQCRETVRNPKSVKVNDKIIYDCVDINKQPSLSHPLLQNHKIQLKPSFSISKPKDKSKSKIQSNKIIECSDGTVPILKYTNVFVTNAQHWAKKHFSPFTIDSRGTHIAGVRALPYQGPYHGVTALMSVHDLNISVDQASYTNIYVGSGVSDKVNFLQIGWMVNPALFGDSRTWSYGFWKGVNGTGCYNTICPGFIQVSRTDPLSIPIPYPRKGDRAIYISILQDKKTGNWWAIHVNYHAPDLNIGYWPKEVFDLIGTNADMVGVLGVVQASPSGKSPPMANYFYVDLKFAGVRASQDQGPYHASAVSDKVNFIQTGWMVNPTLFGDGRPWSYGLWKGINRTGCYNTICPGFIQVSKTDPLSIPLSPLPKGEIGTYLSIKQDKETGNWWAADVKYNGHGMNIGYWPKELFDLISTNAGMVGVTGAVQASPSGKSPPMGNGYLPTKNEMGSARVRDANIIDSNFKVIGSKKYKLEKILDSDKCYGLRDGRKKSFDEGTYVLFTYGGPGGDSCGV
ncbi:hypothetical protein Bca4012_047621 [Brassica carinata]